MNCKTSTIIGALFIIVLGIWYCKSFDDINANLIENTEYSVENSIDKIEDLEENNYKVTINSASYEELITLPEIGEIRANKIIDYRKAHNGFSSVDEIKNISGIGEKTYDAIRNYLTIKD